MKGSRVLHTRTQIEARHAMVTAGHPRGAEVAAGILARGGNAVDAAVACAFAIGL